MADQGEADQSGKQLSCSVHDQWLSPENSKEPDLISAFVCGLLHEGTLGLRPFFSQYLHYLKIHADNEYIYMHYKMSSQAYTLKDYKNMKQEVKLGGLGPMNTIPEAVVNTHFRLYKDLSI